MGSSYHLPPTSMWPDPVAAEEAQRIAITVSVPRTALVPITPGDPYAPAGATHRLDRLAFDVYLTLPGPDTR